MPPNVRGGLSDAWQRGLPDTGKSIGYCEFVDGIRRPIYEDAHGQC
jgi:hypothetical protein